MGWDSLDPAKTNTWVSLGSLDDMESMKPVAQWGSEGRVSWIAEVMALPIGPTGGGDITDDYRQASRIRPRTHPDHDTAVWPPVGIR